MHDKVKSTYFWFLAVADRVTNEADDWDFEYLDAYAAAPLPRLLAQQASEYRDRLSQYDYLWK